LNPIESFETTSHNGGTKLQVVVGLKGFLGDSKNGRREERRDF
jgi:hypothetical protein